MTGVGSHAMSGSSYPGFACAKPAVLVSVERRQRRAAIDKAERVEKAYVRRRDWRCRWPGCRCRRLKLRPEVAHVTRDKGMGGDHGRVSTAADMMLLCAVVHRGQDSLHDGGRRIVFLTPSKANGPCRFERRVGRRWSVEGEERT